MLYSMDIMPCQALLWISFELAEGTNTLFTALKARYGKQSDYWVELNNLSFSDPLLAQDLVKLDTNHQRSGETRYKPVKPVQSADA